MKRIAFAVLLALGLTGCNEMKGNLTAHQVLSLHDKDGKTVEVQQGTYEAELSAKDKTTIKVKIEKAASNGKDLKFYFTLPANTIKNGEFDIPAAQTGQPYGVRGEHTVTTSTSDLQRGYESCQYNTWEQYCWTDRDGRVICQNRQVTRWGQRYVEYRDVTDTENLTLDMIGANNSTAAHFDGERSETYRDYHYQDSFCH